MKITNKSARLYYIDGQKIIPNQTAEIGDSWGDKPVIKQAIERGELVAAAKDEPVTAGVVEKKEKATK